MPLVHLMPKCAALDHYTLRRQALLQLGKSQSRLGGDPAAQSGLRFLQPGPAMAANRKTAAYPAFLLTVSHLVDIEAAYLKAARNRRRAFSPGQSSQHTITQSCEYDCIHTSLAPTGGLSREM
jgi:hypothetical protein